MPKQNEAQYLRVLLRGLTVPGAGVCGEGDLVKREHVPDDLWDLVASGEHPHMVVHEGPVSADRVRKHQPRGTLARKDAPPPTPVRRQVVGPIVGVSEVQVMESGPVDLVYEAPEAVE